MTATARTVVCSLLFLACAPAHRARLHGRIEPQELAPQPNAAPPDFSRDSNVSIVAKGGNSWETSMAISRTHPEVMVFAVIDSTDQAQVTIYRSEDGGVTWSDRQPQALTTSGGKSYARSADPVVIAAGDGSFYLAEILLVAPKGSTSFEGAVIGVSRSTDDGRTWSAPSVVVDRPAGGTPSENDDKEWMAVDPDSGTITVAWAYFLVSGNSPVGNPTIEIARSKDHGATWSTPQPMRTDDLQLTQIASAPGGATYLSYIDYAAGGYQVRVSADRGATFGGEVKALADPDVEGWIIPNSNTLAVTTHTLAAGRGNLYIVAPERRDVLFTRSTDGGRSWSAPLRLGGGQTANILFPAVAVDPTNGDVIVSWLDRRDDPSNTVARVYAARSTDGGATFSSPRAFSSPFTLARKMGDYDVSAAMGGRAVRAFSTESGHASVARLDFSEPPPPVRRRVAH